MKYIFLIVLLASSLSESAFALSFSDTDTTFYRDPITTLTDEGIIAGYGDGRFAPEATITRAEILKVFLGAKGITPEQSVPPCFPDVKETLWYHPYICEGVKLGVVQGFEDGNFGPNMPVTVLEGLAIGLRLYALTPEKTNPWYTSYRDFAEKNGILDISSYSLTTPLTRGKAADLILRIRAYSVQKVPLTSLSQGCTHPKTLTSGTHEITVAGTTRSYILTVPREFTSNNPAKLIIAIHGRTNSNSMVQGYMGLEGGRRGGGQTDFIIAYPAGLPNGKAYSWSSNENIEFVDTIIREVSDSLCVDSTQIDIVAHSLGAWFASKLACTRGDVFRGMAIVGGGGYTSMCNDTPTATLIYQNDNDTLSPASTARSTESKMKSINHCSETTENVQIGNTNCTKWTDCTTGNPVIYCKGYPTYLDDPHSWPIGGGGAILEWLKDQK